MTCHGLIVAAGRGARFGGTLPKQYCLLNDVPVLRRTILGLRRHPRIASIRVAIHPEDRQLYEACVEGLDLLPPVPGGETRQASVNNLLEATEGTADDIVLIHDAARPMVSTDLIDRVIEALAEAPGAIAALPVADTLKRGNGGRITGTIDRTALWRAQTPQAFRLGLARAAHRHGAGGGMTDDAALFEAAGHPVALVLGDEDNFKITTAADLARANRIMMPQTEFRTGTGFDVHRFEPGDGCWINGILVPYSAKLLGHSDADVGLHALTDAILGAIGAGDIGSHFPPSQAQWKGAASEIFLRHAVQRVHQRGGMIAHLNATVVCEMPKIGPHREAMRARIAAIANLALDRVAVTATTSERLGFTGRGEGIAAFGLATVRLPLAAV